MRSSPVACSDLPPHHPRSQRPPLPTPARTAAAAKTTQTGHPLRSPAPSRAAHWPGYPCSPHARRDLRDRTPRLLPSGLAGAAVRGGPVAQRPAVRRRCGRAVEGLCGPARRGRPHRPAAARRRHGVARGLRGPSHLRAGRHRGGRALRDRLGEPRWARGRQAVGRGQRAGPQGRARGAARGLRGVGAGGRAVRGGQPRPHSAAGGGRAVGDRGRDRGVCGRLRSGLVAAGHGGRRPPGGAAARGPRGGAARRRGWHHDPRHRTARGW